LKVSNEVVPLEQTALLKRSLSVCTANFNELINFYSAKVPVQYYSQTYFIIIQQISGSTTHAPQVLN